MTSLAVEQYIEKAREQLYTIRDDQGQRRVMALGAYADLLNMQLIPSYALDALYEIGFSNTEAYTAQQDFAKRQAAANQPGRRYSLYDYINGTAPLPPDMLEQFKVMGEDLEPAMGEFYLNTTRKLAQALENYYRSDVPMAPIQAWECRIGASRFFIPPTSIGVSQKWRTGSMGGAIRQSTSVKFNSGHADTIITMRLYFPTAETIWGFDGERLEIDFDSDNESIIDTYASSLRGLITQFRYAPFLPIKNVFLNKTFNITAVALEAMTLSTVPEFPFCVQVDLRMLKFNHKVYLPMIEDFDTAIHWGKFRQYMGRGAYKLNEAATKQFLLSTANKADDVQPTDNLDLSKVNFDKRWEWESGKNFEIYYPEYDPAKLIGPTLDMFVSTTDPDTVVSEGTKKSWWQTLLNDYLGISLDLYPDADYVEAQRRAGYLGSVHDQRVDSVYASEGRLINNWLQRVNATAFAMGPAL